MTHKAQIGDSGLFSRESLSDLGRAVFKVLLRHPGTPVKTDPLVDRHRKCIRDCQHDRPLRNKFKTYDRG